MSAEAPTNIARYQVLNHIEAGGMGSVYLARDPAIDRLVAIKLLKEGFDNAELRERFMREARSAGRLRHINIVTIFDVGEHDSQPFIAMEYVEGETLYALIKRKAALSIGRKIHLMDELAAGLHYAHRAGIVHRDIKPKNIMLDADGVLKVLDFGIARVADAGGGIKTQAGMLMGTLNFMAPEQMMGLPDVDARADQFSAGAVFYELLSYQPAFPGGLETGILHRIINTNPEPLRSIDPRLDQGLVAIVNRCLDKSRDNRYPDMAAVRRDLAAVRRRLGVDNDDEGTAATIAGTRPSAVEDVATPKPSRRDSSRQELDRLRAAQIRTHLEEARKALDSQDFTGALNASQRALLLKDDEPAALEYEQRAREAIEQRQAQQLLSEARSELDRGALTAASMLVARAESLTPASREAAAVRSQLDEARRQLAERQARAAAVDASLAAARSALAAGSLDAASARVDEAVALDPDNAEAAELRRTIAAAAEAQRRAADEARAREAIQAAREEFAAGSHAGAIARLERFQPASLVADQLNELRFELKEIERRRREAERLAEEARRAEAARKAEEARQAEIARKAEEARQAEIARKAEEARHAEIARKAEEARRAEIARKAEEARQAGIARKAEEARQAEIARKAEEARQAEAARRAEQARRAEAARQEEARKADEARKAAERAEAETAARRKREAEEKRAAEDRIRAAEDADATRILPPRRDVTEPPPDATILMRPPSVAEPESAPTIPLSSPAVAPASVDAAASPAPSLVVAAAGSGSFGKYIGIAAAAIVLVAAVMWKLETGGTKVVEIVDTNTNKPAAISTPPGSVVLDIAPWARIDAITRKPDGKAASGGCQVTPCVLSLPAGDYHVRASNPNFPGPLEFDVAVAAGNVREVRQALPGFKAEDEVSKILDK